MDLDAELAELAKEMILVPARVRLPRPPHRTLETPPVPELESDDVFPPDPRGALDTG